MGNDWQQVTDRAIRACARAFSCALILCLFCSRPSFAQLTNHDTNAPVMLAANEMGYDRKNALVVAIGSVEVIQGETIVLADRITYNQNTGEVHATGNVSLKQPNGDILFAENVRLKDNLSAGIVKEFRARMSDNSLFAAREARKISADVTELDYAVYTPCELCEDKAPLWQLKSEKVTIDETEQRVTYRNASLELAGIPVMWTPYFSHATPNADAKSGILTPEWANNSELGAMVSIPYYQRFAPNLDATLTPTFTTNEGSIMNAEVRYKADNGYTEFTGSITNPKKRDNTGDKVPGRELRGHIEANGQFSLAESLGQGWNWGYNIHRTTDDTYMRRYNISQTDLLTSTLYLEGVDGRQWTSLQGLSFQRLTDDVDDDQAPHVLPLADYWWESDPGWLDSRMELSANSMMLVREEGTQSRRVSMTGAWQLPWVAPGGHVFEAVASLRGDVYSSEDVPIASRGGQLESSQDARIIPQLELNWRYPLINQYAPGRSLLIEPVVSFVTSPNGVNDEEIANEDSLLPEFSDSNLFLANRYPGYDLIETGSRFNYGLRGQWQFADANSLQFVFGQNYRFSDDNRFPFTNTLDDQFSDYVGRFGLTWGEWLTMAYRFRADRDDFELRRNELNTLLTYENLAFSVDYLQLNDDPYLANRQEIVGSGSLRITDHWTFIAGARRDLDDDEMIYANSGLQYQDECISILGNFARSFISDRDVEPNTSFIFRIALKNLE